MKRSVLMGLAAVALGAGGVAAYLATREIPCGDCDGEPPVFAGVELCTWERCLPDNRDFIAFVEENHGKAAVLAFDVDIPVGAGAFQADCQEELVPAHPHEGADRMIIAILPNLEACVPEGAIFLEVPAADLTHVTATTGVFKDRISGRFVITSGTYGGAPLYGLARAPG